MSPSYCLIDGFISLGLFVITQWKVWALCMVCVKVIHLSRPALKILASLFDDPIKQRHSYFFINVSRGWKNFHLTKLRGLNEAWIKAQRELLSPMKSSCEPMVVIAIQQVRTDTIIKKNISNRRTPFERRKINSNESITFSCRFCVSKFFDVTKIFLLKAQFEPNRFFFLN